MRSNTSITWDTQGQYATDLFTRIAVDKIHSHNPKQPLFLYLSQLAAHAGNQLLTDQAPEEEIAKFAFIKNPLRRQYAAVMSKLDESVGKVITALKDKGLMENSLIVFAADNGSPIMGELHNSGSNYPFRGVSVFKNCNNIFTKRKYFSKKTHRGMEPHAFYAAFMPPFFKTPNVFPQTCFILPIGYPLSCTLLVDRYRIQT